MYRNVALQSLKLIISGEMRFPVEILLQCGEISSTHLGNESSLTNVTGKIFEKKNKLKIHGANIAIKNSNLDANETGNFNKNKWI